MLGLFRLWFGAVLSIFRNRHSLILENLALRQQLAVLKRKHPRPRLGPLDKLFWVLARRLWPRWKKTLVIVLPDTVVRWHRAGFKLYWTMLCKVRKRVGGGRRISKQIRELIFQMVAENPTWGAPRILRRYPPRAPLLLDDKILVAGKCGCLGGDDDRTCGRATRYYCRQVRVGLNF